MDKVMAATNSHCTASSLLFASQAPDHCGRDSSALHVATGIPAVLNQARSRVLKSSFFSAKSLRAAPILRDRGLFGAPSRSNSNTLSVECAVLLKESYGAAKKQGTGRAVMEDELAVVISESGPSFFGVFDGHGGGDVSKFLQKELWPVYSKYISGGDPVTGTEKAYLEVDKLTLAAPKGFFGALRERGIGGSRCGSTAATAVLLSEPGGKRLLAANVGDSRVVLSRGGKAIQLTVDHTPDMVEERKRIEKKNPFPKKPLVVNVEGIWRVGGLLALSRAFGDVYLKNWSDGRAEGASGGYGLTAEPTIFSEPLTAEDEWLVLGTDGLFDKFSNQELVDMCQAYKGESLEGLAERMIDVAQERGTTDDITVILVKI